jgi:Tfp pilus assembly protein PilF
VALRESQRFDEAEEAYRWLVAFDPRNAEAHAGLAVVAHRLGKLDEAIDEYRVAVELGDGGRVADAVLAPFGTALLESGQADEAMAMFQRAFAAPTTREEDICRCALVFHRQGHLDQAIALLRQSVEHRGDSVRVTAMVTYFEAIRAPTAVALDRIETLLGDPELAPDVARSLHLGLARLYDRSDRHDAAFEHALAGNALADVTYDAEARREFVTESRAAFSPDRLAALPRAEPPSDLPVFIVGMPRSGTTLVEQIVSSHPTIFGGGELEEFRTMALELPKTLGTDVPAAECAALVDQDMVQRLADRYLAHLDTLDSDALRVTDKMPGNFQRLDLIALLFPGARVIHCRRNPLDVSLSCYFHDFSQGHTYTYDLTELGTYYHQYERLMDHWRDVLPVAMLDLTYEDLISDQETVSRRMIDFCGVPWDDACLSFQDNDRSVFTSSMWQVRQPLYQTSVDRWRHYDSHLGPLKSALGTTDI